MPVGPVQPYQPPYFDLVGEKPTLEQMKEIVVSSKQRPPISGKWYSNKVSYKQQYGPHNVLYKWVNALFNVKR